MQLLPLLLLLLLLLFSYGSLLCCLVWCCERWLFFLAAMRFGLASRCKLDDMVGTDRCWQSLPRGGDHDQFMLGCWGLCCWW